MLSTLCLPQMNLMSIKGHISCSARIYVPCHCQLILLTDVNVCRKQREEAELYASLKQAREMARKLEEEKQKAEEEEKIRVEQLRVNIGHTVSLSSG